MVDGSFNKPLGKDLELDSDENQNIFSEQHKKYIENIGKIYSTDFQEHLGRDYQVTVEPDGYISMHDLRLLQGELRKIQDKYHGFTFVIRATLL